MRKFIIFSPKYSDKSGGVICLHYLTHLINEVGGEAYIFPRFFNYEINKYSLARGVVKSIYSRIVDPLRKFKTNPLFNTPIFNNYKKIKNSDEWIVIYPEIVFGNPLEANNVVRWLLHDPGYHTKKIHYGPGELYFRYQPGFARFEILGSKCSENLLYIEHYPIHLYNEKGVSPRRKGVAYCVYKGKGREIVHTCDDAILIDDLSHEEISLIFKRVEVFISYDTRTAYSVLAALCGCDSVVVPVDGVSAEMWMPSEEFRHGIAYGFDDLPRARMTRGKLIDRINSANCRNRDSVTAFMAEANNYFDAQN